jgi:prenyltransferase beta subunit
MKLIFGTLLATSIVSCGASLAPAQDILPKHITPQAQSSIKKGLDFLAKAHSEDGSFAGGRDGQAYPVAMTALAGMAFLANGNTPSRGPYADHVAKIVEYLTNNVQPGGLITGPTQEQGFSMYGHGFSLMFLSSCYGMETNDKMRDRMKKIINNGVKLTASASSNGGWCYTPGSGDEGSVTVTQIQGLRAASNAGFTVPKGAIEGGVRYLENCRTPEGGICYSLGSVGADGAHLPISAAAIATLYNAGEYDSKLADSCLNYVSKQFDIHKDNFEKGSGHAYYTHLYASQAFYQAGDKYWDKYFPGARDQLIKMQSGDGSWAGDGIGQVYGTSIALVILQLPYKYLPIYQR